MSLACVLNSVADCNTAMFKDIVHCLMHLLANEVSLQIFTFGLNISTVKGVEEQLKFTSKELTTFDV